MMKIAVIGATGKAGNLIAREALHRGHEVTAIVRNAAKLAPGLFQAIEMDIMDIKPEDIRGFDAVVDAYGCAPGQEEQQVTVMNHLIGVFEQAPGVRLLVVGGAASLYKDKTMTRQFYEDLPPAAKLPIFAAKALNNLKASHANWTFFSPALRFDPKGTRTGSYTLGSDYIFQNNGGESYISYADYAIAMVDEIENKAFIGRRFTAVAEKAGLPQTEPGGRMRFTFKQEYGLAGRNFHFVMDNGCEYVATMLDGETLAWAGQGEPFVYQNYQCAKANSQTYLVSFFITEENVQKCVTLVIDLQNSLVTMVKAAIGSYPARPRLVSHHVVFGAIGQDGKPLPVVRHGYTTELVGKKIAWQYSPKVKITHIYLTEHYMRGSLKNMPPVDEDATEEQKREIEDRAKRWGALFFEEPCFYIKISKNMFLMGMIEDFRNRVNPATGGGDLLVLIDTVMMRDYIRSFSLNAPLGPEIHLSTALGEFIDTPDEMESAPSPYRLP